MTMPDAPNAIPDTIPLPAIPGIETRVHVFETKRTTADPPGAQAGPRQAPVAGIDSRDALRAALGAKRPLLVRGEPGVGKTQLAEAAAVALGRLLLTITVDSRTESRDLLYSFDAVRRLAEAQLLGSTPCLDDKERAQRRDDLDPRKFLIPGPLWWAFNWRSALEQADLAGAPKEYDETKWSKAQGAVLLIDEIDKAEADVPNGLLEALGSRHFVAPHGAGTVAVGQHAPLVIITTNEERSLPDPFLRRCVVLTLKLPGNDRDVENRALQDFLIARGRSHFPRCSQAVLETAAEQLARDRHAAFRDQVTPLPGQAEYLDLVRATLDSDPDPSAQLKNLQRFSEFILRKHGERK